MTARAPNAETNGSGLSLSLLDLRWAWHLEICWCSSNQTRNPSYNTYKSINSNSLVRQWLAVEFEYTQPSPGEFGPEVSKLSIIECCWSPKSPKGIQTNWSQSRTSCTWLLSHATYWVAVWFFGVGCDHNITQPCDHTKKDRPTPRTDRLCTPERAAALRACPPCWSRAVAGLAEDRRRALYTQRYRCVKNHSVRRFRIQKEQAWAASANTCV